MRSTNLSVGLTTLALMALAVIGIATSSLAQTETILHNFGNNGTDRVIPEAA